MEENKKKSWDELVKEAPYLYVEDTMKKNPDEVVGELKEILIGYGYECLDDYDCEQDWLEKHPEVDEKDCDWHCFSDLEFLCSNEPYVYEHDVDWCEFNITFYGIWGGSGVFQVAY